MFNGTRFHRLSSAPKVSEEVKTKKAPIPI